MRTQKIRKAVALIVLLTFCSSLTVFAEEKTPAGYHVYDVQEDEVTDTWYGIARGGLIQAGIAKIKQGKTGYAICSGTTLANGDHEELYVAIYLDESDDGKSDWGTIASWYNTAYNDSYVMVCSGEYPITTGKYYSVRGAHTVFEGDESETSTTCTDGLYFD